MAQTMPADEGPVRVSLERGDTEDDTELPYRRVNLTVQYDSPDPSAGDKYDVIRCITIRSVRGGPTMLFNVTIPPGAPAARINMVLPALSAEDSYDVRLLAGNSAETAVIAQFNLTLDWPAELVTAQGFLDPDAYDAGDYLPPVWSNRMLGLVFMISAIVCVMLAASLLVRPTGWRLFTATVTAIVAGSGLWMTVISESTILRRRVGDDNRLLLVSCLRDDHCEILEPYTTPLYYNLDEMTRDDAVIRTPEKLIVRLKSGEVRLFARREPVNQPATIPSDI